MSASAMHGGDNNNMNNHTVHFKKSALNIYIALYFVI